MKGIIALDIDGTITTQRHDISKEVVNYLSSLAREGWQFIFVTGRSFQWGYSVLCHMPFPYYFAVQNGAIILSMPERKIIDKKYLKKEILPEIEQICLEEHNGCIVYAGYEYQDQCFYRPSHFQPCILDYVHYRVEMLKESWISLSSSEILPLEEFASVKCFAVPDSAERISKEIENRLGLHVPPMRDAFDSSYYVIQATHSTINKGNAVRIIKELINCEGPVIAAGDDNNDRSMLELADIKIVMETAPDSILQLADIVAPSAKNHGIIQGLAKATHKGLKQCLE